MDSVDRGSYFEAAPVTKPFASHERQKPSVLSPFRYPGGKSRLRERIINWITSLPQRPSVFIEPFLGGGSISLAIAELGLADQIVAAEIDPDVSAVWRVALNENFAELCERILNFRLTRETASLELQSTDDALVSVAFRCILRNRIQRGGVMAPGAGLLNRGEGDKGISSRWYPETLIRRINEIHRLAPRIQFLAEDGLSTLNAFSQIPNCCAFIDPPYVAGGRGAGKRLYTHYDVSAEAVFEAAANFIGPAILTYHRSRIIRRLAESSGMICSELSVRNAHDKLRRELFITKEEAAATRVAGRRAA
jgi:DNA adenine methylase